jgi:hypothetical protein
MEIYGLTERQRQIADLLWTMETQDEVKSFIKGLRGSMKRDAEIVLEMMILAVIDDVTETSAADKVIERLKWNE